MSRYTIQRNGFVVSIGWDAPIGYYFLTIENNKEEMIWSNLDQKNAFPRNYLPYLNVIREIVGIELSDKLIERLNHDKKYNTTNYTEDF